MELIEIQKLQFSDKAAAEEKMLAFLKENEDPSIKSVELRPRPESLNSINGFINYLDGERLFFKTHVEENEQLSEYYNASMLAKAGYPLISTKQVEHRPGKQIALYEIVTLPTLFDLLKEEEDFELGGIPETDRARTLLSAQKQLEERVLSIYRQTLEDGSSATNENKNTEPPIHQLFYHRLAEDGRFGIFYKGKAIPSDQGEIKFDDLATKHWVINGVRYSDSLATIIERSRTLLTPGDSASIVGHGDAHNGNIFVDLENRTLNMFDPAFAGRHDMLLDLTKPLFHNIFARWMYFPEQVSDEFDLRFKIAKSEIVIEHDFIPSRLRLSHFKVKLDNLLQPAISLLKECSKNKDIDQFKEFLHSSLFCCPFLTVNLFAPYVADGTLSERYSLPIKMLGLSMAVALGSSNHDGENGLSAIVDQLFDF